MAAPVVIVPIFPLPDVTFFPHTLLPLHVFEARYRAMVIDVLARDRRLAVVKLQPGYEASYAGKPAVHPVAGLGEIVSCERLATGRYNIMLKGECRLRFEQRAAERHALPGGARPAAGRHRAGRRRRAGAGADSCRLPLAARARSSAPSIFSTPRSPTARPPASSPTAWPPPSCPTPICARRLLETLDAGARVTRVADAVESLVRELKGGRE